MHFKILGDLYISNHHLVPFLSNLSTNPLGGSSWKVGVKFIQKTKDLIKALWEAPPLPLPLLIRKLGNWERSKDPISIFVLLKPLRLD